MGQAGTDRRETRAKEGYVPRKPLPPQTTSFFAMMLG